jgi:hypothetical protein
MWAAASRSSVMKVNAPAFGGVSYGLPTVRDRAQPGRSPTRGSLPATQAQQSRPSTGQAPFQGASRATVPLSSFLGGPPSAVSRPVSHLRKPQM